MSQLPTIYVTHRTRLDLTEASKFGVVRYASNETGPYPAPDGDKTHKEGVYRDMEIAMSNFVAERDYLLMVGDPIYCGLLMWFAMNRSEPGDFVNVLRYDRALGVYIPVQVCV
jgi:hypothetical protein